MKQIILVFHDIISKNGIHLFKNGLIKHKIVL